MAHRRGLVPMRRLHTRIPHLLTARQRMIRHHTIHLLMGQLLMEHRVKVERKAHQPNGRGGKSSGCKSLENRHPKMSKVSLTKSPGGMCLWVEQSNPTSQPFFYLKSC